MIDVIVELYLSVTWNKQYFMFGIPIYSKEYSLLDNSNRTINIRRLDTLFKSWIMPSYTFHRFDDHLYGFRFKFFQFTLLNYKGIMHGTISIDNINNKIIVKGRLDIFAIIFPVLFILFFVLNINEGFDLLVIITFMLILKYIQMEVATMIQTDHMLLLKTRLI